MIGGDLLSECDAIAREVAPELFAEGRNFYILDAAELDGLPVWSHDDALGFCVEPYPVDYAIRDRLGDRWRGPGPIIGLHTHERTETLGVMLHEIGHAVPIRRIPDDAEEAFDYPEIHSLQLAMAKSLLEAGQNSDKYRSLDRDWHDHRFVRRCAHLWARARVAGWDVPVLSVLTSVQSLLPYVDALFHELHHMRNETFSVIEATTPPQRFLKLFENT